MSRARDLASGSGIEAGEAIPHIIPDVLYPAVANIMVDGSTALSAVTTGPNGSTVTSSKYGTVQSDGRMYYYTDIKGSKPIKDPRIGSHFGSQRHKFTSLQLLEQETATHSKEVHSVDGREWIRVVEGTSKWYVENGSSGVFLNVDSNATGMFFEITGYFNDINLLGQTADDRGNDVDITVNGDSASRVDGATTFDTTTASPLGSRFVSGSSLINLGSKTALGSSTLKAELGTTPAINTVKIEWMATSIYERISGIELIAQDTTSTANKSKIQIPSQNVVSYGKKFTVSGTPHYDPFNGFTNGSSVTAYVDTATSLGVEAWKNSSTYYRPYNGGRVVKWVASDGTIKTSVNMMPPNAQNIAGSTISAKANASVANNTYLPTFSGAIDDSLSESSKTFINEEFGNGSANDGTGGTYADASMLSSGSDEITYVMDDGLTSLSANAVTKGTNAGTGGYINIGNGDAVYTTFIGTGITLGITNWNGDAKYLEKVAFNLPYGTHILKVSHETSNVVKYLIDSVEVKSVTATVWGPIDFTFHQPKMPPIPEDAVIISDYMLMADTVHRPDNDGTTTHVKIHKGIRRVSASRDIFYNGSATINYGQHTSYGIAHGHRVYHTNTDASKLNKLPYFGTGVTFSGQLDSAYHNNALFKINGTAVTASSTGTNHSGTQVLYSQTTGSTSFRTDNDGTFTMQGSGEGYAGVTGIILGPNEVEVTADATSNYYLVTFGFDVQTPTHTSSHYQTFETPFLHELVGGDRNMEQHNLIVTPDGKTWDEVTRDVSYIGANMYRWHWTTGNYTTSNVSADNTHKSSSGKPWVCRGDLYGFHFEQKNFAPAYDRHICLKNGTYELHCHSYHDTSWGEWNVYVNGTSIGKYSRQPSTDEITSGDFLLHLKRGDYVQVQGGHYVSAASNSEYYIKKLD